MTRTASSPIALFFSYSHRDEKLREQLEKHLSQLRDQKLISAWHDRRIGPGREWASEIDQHLEIADVILLLVSADFLASDYCREKEARRALERHQQGSAIVVPIILRKVDWKNSPLASLQALPKDGKPITSWSDRDAAFLDVAMGIRRLAESFSDCATAHIVPSNHPDEHIEAVSMAARTQYRVVVEGTLGDFSKADLDSMLREMRRVSSDVTLRIENVLAGSIILNLDGTVAGYEKLRNQAISGQLERELGVKVLLVETRHATGSGSVGRRHTKKLYVGNLSYDIDSSALEALFRPHGTVESAEIIADRDTGRSKGFGFVEMSSDAEAQAAIEALDGQACDGRNLTINEAEAAEKASQGRRRTRPDSR